ncbi:peroxidasin-like [Branchiostoma floridae]|uniref:Peroxidasin-like n=1 Tax=Branchiostoma floridae TaxID=7739 RepID=A0A9J7L9S8_BRAFL|nr:peroxidasin-like [Branchiostoma floridae]
MFIRLIPVFLVAVAMTPMVVMVAGQTPTEQELQEAFNQAKAEIELEVASHVDQIPEESPYSGALGALALEHRSTPMAIELSKCATVLEKMAKHFMDSSRRTSYTVAMLSACNSHIVTSVCDDTSMKPITCPAPAVPEFRSADGRCNNRNHPLWGSTEQPLRRLLDPVYDDDLMITRTAGRDGTPLPSARLVSTTVHEDLRKSSPVNTHMVMQFGQFLDHDITLTPNFAEGEEGLRCPCDSTDERCFNIPVPSDDPDFSTPCLEFARSRSCPNEGCRMGRRQQLNQLTAFVDASNVYGSSEEEMEALRERNEPRGAQKKTTFPSPRSTSNYARLGTSLSQDLTSFTLCLHMRTDMSSSSDAGLVSYAVTQHNNELLVFNKGGIGFRLYWSVGDTDFSFSSHHIPMSSDEKGVHVIEICVFQLFVQGANVNMGGLPVWDGARHAVCVTWRSSDGAWQVYADGARRNSGSGLRVGGRVRSGGTFILAQDQDTVGGGFAANQAFSGELSQVNLWDRVLTAAEVGSDWSAFCNHHGNVIDWATANIQVSGQATTDQYSCQVTSPPGSGVNLALSRPTAQSSTGFGGSAGRAVDANTDGNFHSGSCTHTNQERNPWWRVDLGTAQAIGNVVVFNRKDCCSDRLNNFQVHVGNSPTVASNPQCGGNNAVTGGSRPDITVDCGGLRGRYVGILLPSTEALTLCEVQVYAAPPPPQVPARARGLLKSRPNPADANKKELLPSNTEEMDFLCEESTGNQTCSAAGDIRVNEQPGLTSMHTAFLREHNRIARGLSRINPNWDDDRVFYETRKIVGALMQKITYGEDLPHVLGPAAMTRFHLTLTQSGFFSGYDPNVNPTISNVFATAAYRFGHSLVNNFFNRFDPDFTQGSTCPIQLAFAFFNPSHIFDNAQGGPDSILRGLTAQPHQDFDRFMVSGLTKRLFADPPGSDRGLDLAALNIQRGRDHGLPGYNAWRVRCGLPKANSFDELAFEIPDCFTRRRLENLYRHVDDIDVFVGGLAEESVSGGVVGPTFACLIGMQFRDLRKGDRFWFENPGQFTAAQLAEIRKASLARILCDNTDGTTQMQPDVFRQPTQSGNGNGNGRVACSSLPQMDLTKWQE